MFFAFRLVFGEYLRKTGLRQLFNLVVRINRLVSVIVAVAQHLGTILRQLRLNALLAHTGERNAPRVMLPPATVKLRVRVAVRVVHVKHILISQRKKIVKQTNSQEVSILVTLIRGGPALLVRLI